MGTPESYRACHCCQQTVRCDNTREVKTFATYAGEMDPTVMLGAFVCLTCYATWYDPTKQPERANGERI